MMRDKPASNDKHETSRLLLTAALCSVYLGSSPCLASAANGPADALPPPSPVPAPFAPTRIDRPQKRVAPVKPTATSRSGSDTRISRPGEMQMLAPTADVLPGKPGLPPPSPVPPRASPNPAAGSVNAAGTAGGAGATDQYPAIGKLEEVTLGKRQADKPISERLAALEMAVFKRAYSDDTLFDRTDRLKKTIIGGSDVDPNSAAAREETFGATGSSYQPGMDAAPGADYNDPSLTGQTAQAEHYLDELARRPENREALPPEQIAQFAIEIINTERRNYGFAPVTPDNGAEKLALDHVKLQAAAGAVTHFDKDGSGPDRRYTLSEGTDALTECVASVKTAELGGIPLSKASAAVLIKTLISRQDDRDALLSPDATHIGFGIAQSQSGDRVFGTFEMVNRHGVMGPLPAQALVGDKLEVKGVIHAPYIFDRISLAWEAYNPDAISSASDDSEEALPYFPPLDYVAYASRSEQNHDRLITTLKFAGMTAAIAGGLFIPPIALAAPLIAVAGSTSEPRPVSDIPVKGGVKLDGASFNGKIPLNNGNKDGLYYVTVWGALGRGQKSVPISRRVILVKGPGSVETDITGEKLTPSEVKQAEKIADKDDAKLAKKSKKEKKSKKSKDQGVQNPDAQNPDTQNADTKKTDDQQTGSTSAASK